MPRRTKKGSFTQRILHLIAEPEFVKFEHMLGEPNFFKIVGRAHYERWHSAFFGWLLDPHGSHLLADYVLRRFLLLLLDERCLKATNHNEHFFATIFPVVDFVSVEVTPNEYIPTETSIASVGRFDIYLTAGFQDDSGNRGNLNIIFELKIDSKPNGHQSSKYADWLFNNHPDDVNFLIYVIPNLMGNAAATVGDARWYCLDYQLLNDKLLIPLLDHPKLNEKAKPFVVQYMKNLKTRYRGIKMAITEDEKKLALALYEKYNDVFDSIYDALVSTGAIDFSTSDVGENRGRSTGRLAVKVGGKLFSNETVRLLFAAILQFLVDEDILVRLPLPWGTSRQRYIVTNESLATHPNGRPFFYPVEFGGYTMESHYDRDRAIKVLQDLCHKLEIDFELINT